MTPPEGPALAVSTTPLDDPGPLVSLLGNEAPLLWSRRGMGLAGFGEALRLEFSGADRFAEAADAWRALCATALVSDEVGRPGTGLVAFGAFAFADGSAARSTLIVPSVVVGRGVDGGWLTRITAASTAVTASAPIMIPAPTPPIAPPPVGAGSSHLVPGALSREGYVEIVADATRRIREGELAKVVLARDLVGEWAPDADLRRPLTALADAYPDCWTFCVDGFLGSSPEMLVSVQGGTVSARVLAGSAPRGADPTTDTAAATALATSTKDQDEHEFAVMSVLAALAPYSPGVRASEQPFTLRLPNLWHLASDVEGPLDEGVSSLDLVSAVHPSAAVAGTPRETALALIAELEPFDRGRYAGPVGWVDARGDGEWAIGLRCAEVANGQVTAWAGAGIVADSVPEHELAETGLKFRPVIDAFG